VVGTADGADLLLLLMEKTVESLRQNAVVPEVDVIREDELRSTPA